MISKLLLLSILSSLVFNCHGQTWDEWFRQKKTQKKYMLQQIAKLQLYLGYLKNGYDIVHDGMNLVSDIKNGDLALHSLFFDHLKRVSPAVKHYEKVTEMIRMYTAMFNTYKSNFKQFTASGNLSNTEVGYLYNLFTNLLDQASNDIKLLTEIITDYNLEMSDAERLKRIDTLYTALGEKYTSLFSFIGKINVLLHQRQKELKDLQTLQNLYAP